MQVNLVTKEVIGAAIEVHRALGPGLLESAYEACLCRELQLRELSFARQVDLPINYKGHKLDKGYRIDILVMNQVVVELKAIDQLARRPPYQLQRPNPKKRHPPPRQQLSRMKHLLHLTLSLSLSLSLRSLRLCVDPSPTIS